MDSDTTDHRTAALAADRAWTDSQTAANAAKERLFDTLAAAVSAGHTPDALAADLRANKTGDELEAGLTFTGAYIRKVVRARGVQALPGGPKPRRAPTDRPGPKDGDQ